MPTCPLCKKEKRNKAYEDHLRYHKRTADSKSKSIIDDEIKRFRLSRTFVCNSCDKGFLTRSKIEEHYLISDCQESIAIKLLHSLIEDGEVSHENEEKINKIISTFRETEERLKILEGGDLTKNDIKELNISKSSEVIKKSPDSLITNFESTDFNEILNDEQEFNEFLVQIFNLNSFEILMNIHKFIFCNPKYPEFFNLIFTNNKANAAFKVRYNGSWKTEQSDLRDKYLLYRIKQCINFCIETLPKKFKDHLCKNKIDMMANSINKSLITQTPEQILLKIGKFLFRQIHAQSKNKEDGDLTLKWMDDISLKPYNLMSVENIHQNRHIYLHKLFSPYHNFYFKVGTSDRHISQRLKDYNGAAKPILFLSQSENIEDKILEKMKLCPENNNLSDIGREYFKTVDQNILMRIIFSIKRELLGLKPMTFKSTNLSPDRIHNLSTFYLYKSGDNFYNYGLHEPKDNIPNIIYENMERDYMMMIQVQDGAKFINQLEESLGSSPIICENYQYVEKMIIFFKCQEL